jgi:hypothetical protein
VPEILSDDARQIWLKHLFHTCWRSGRIPHKCNAGTSNGPTFLPKDQPTPSGEKVVVW